MTVPLLNTFPYQWTLSAIANWSIVSLKTRNSIKSRDGINKQVVQNSVAANEKSWYKQSRQLTVWAVSCNADTATTYSNMQRPLHSIPLQAVGRHDVHRNGEWPGNKGNNSNCLAVGSAGY